MAREDYIEIPEGYCWCEECQALTPHTIPSPIFSWWKDYRDCAVCDSRIDFGNDLFCPKCGWSYESYYDEHLMSEYNYIQVHRSGCHYKEKEADYEEENIIYPVRHLYSYAEEIWDDFIGHNQRFKNVEEIKCSCPSYKIITDPYCYRSVSGYGSGYECYNDLWWTLYIRCPICGERFEINDGTC